MKARTLSGLLVQMPFDLGKNSRPTIFSNTELFPELCDPMATICGSEIKSELKQMFTKLIRFDSKTFW